MARTGAAAKQPENLPAPRAEAGLPADMAQLMDEYAGAGGSQDADDNLIPLIYILQDNSPQVKSRDPAYVQGAQPGDIWFRGTNRVVKGSEGIVVQSCAFHKDVIEWTPRNRGGGMVGKHDVEKASQIPGAREVPDPENPKRKRWRSADDNELQETRYHFVIYDGDRSAYVVPFSGTGHGRSRGWMQQMNSITTPSGKIAPHWTRKWRLTTREFSNAAGSWFGWDYKLEGDDWVQSDEFKRGAALFEAVNKGDVKAEDVDMPGSGDDGAADEHI